MKISKREKKKKEEAVVGQRVARGSRGRGTRVEATRVGGRGLVWRLGLVGGKWISCVWCGLDTVPWPSRKDGRGTAWICLGDGVGVGVGVGVGDCGPPLSHS